MPIILRLVGPTPNRLVRKFHGNPWVRFYHLDILARICSLRNNLIFRACSESEVIMLLTPRSSGVEEWRDSRASP